MSNETIYIERHPGDSITAGDWNSLQSMIRSDIESTATEAANAIDSVDSATNAQQLDGKTFEELTDEITKRVLSSVQTESGYRKVFRVLEQGEFDIIEHGLGNFPLVDVYKLQYFEVVCREDDRTYPTIATFYLHHSSEKRIRVADEQTGERRTIDIQPTDFPPVGIPFVDMLAHYNVQYTDSTSLEDLEVEFWKAFFSDPNDPFDDEQYCHSPWFERCCRDQLDIATIKSRGDLNDILFQVRPWKVIGGPIERSDNDISPFVIKRAPVPANVGVAHVDLNRVVVWLTGEAFHSNDDAEEDLPSEFADKLKVMVLLRV